MGLKSKQYEEAELKEEMRIKKAKNEKISYLLPLLVDSCWLDGLLTYWLPHLHYL